MNWSWNYDRPITKCIQKHISERKYFKVRIIEICNTLRKTVIGNPINTLNMLNISKNKLDTSCLNLDGKFKLQNHI